MAFLAHDSHLARPIGRAARLLAAASVAALLPRAAGAQAGCRLTDFKCLRDAARTAVKSGATSGRCAQNATHQCAAPATLGGRLGGALGRETRELYYKLTLTEPGVLQAALTEMPNRTDVTLTLADAKYAEVGEVIFPTGQPGERLLQVASPGTYYLHLRVTTSAPDEPFALVVTSTPTASAPAGCALNNTFQCASAAALGEPGLGIIGRNRREVYYRLALDAPGVLRFALDPAPTRMDVSLSLTNAAYDEVGTARFPAGQPGGRLLQVAAPGVYYVRLQATTSAPDERFTLTVMPSRNSGPRVAAGATGGGAAGGACSKHDSFQCAAPLAPGATAAGVVGANNREVYYRLPVRTPGVLQFTLDPAPAGTAVQLALTNAAYEEEGSATFPAGQPGRRVLQVARAGTYYVRLRPSRDVADERYTLRVTGPR